MTPESALWQPDNLGALREVFLGFSEDVRTHGFLSTPFDIFGFFVVVNVSVVEDWPDCMKFYVVSHHASHAT